MGKQAAGERQKTESTDRVSPEPEQEPNRESEKPVDQAKQPLTCSVQEFAAIVGISRDRAYELVHSEFPPPGFKVGKGYRIIKSRIEDYIDQLFERELAARRRTR